MDLLPGAPQHLALGVLLAFLVYVAAAWLDLLPKRMAERTRISTSAAFVTGCDCGIGREICLQLLRNGHLVFAGVLSEQAGEDLRQSARELAARGEIPRSENPRIDGEQPEDRVIPIVCDVTSQTDVENAALVVDHCMSWYECSLRILVNNAAVTAFGFAETLPMERFETNMAVNYLGTVRVTREFLPLLRNELNSSFELETVPRVIVNIGSIGARQASGFGSAYLSAKAAMCHFSDCLRQELSGQEKPIRVVLIEPGFFGSNLLKTGTINGAAECTGYSFAAEKMNGHPDTREALAAKRLEETDHPAALYGEFAPMMEGTASTIRLMERLNGPTTSIARLVGRIAGMLSAPKARYVIGYDARVIQTLVALLPSWLVDLEFAARFRRLRKGLGQPMPKSERPVQWARPAGRTATSVGGLQRTEGKVWRRKQDS